MTGNSSSKPRAVAIAAGALAVLVSLYLLPQPQAIWAAGLAAAMCAISISDAERFIVPDIFSLPAIPAGLLASGYLGGGEASIVAAGNLAGMLGAVLLLLAVRELYSRTRGREGLGLGDVKLGAVAGAWTGIAGFLQVLLVASLTALAVVLAIGIWNRILGGPTSLTAATAVPFGAFLAPAIWLVYVFPQ